MFDTCLYKTSVKFYIIEIKSQKFRHDHGEILPLCGLCSETGILPGRKHTCFIWSHNFYKHVAREHWN